MTIKIIRADQKYIKDISILFDLYRQFYKYKKDMNKSQNYINERIKNNDSIIFIGLYDEKVVGFVQLYETFDSLNLNKKLVLYDLYVLKEYRKLGIGTKLMLESKGFAIKNKYISIELSTSVHNLNAQKLYETLDYIRDKEYYNYELNLKN